LLAERWEAMPKALRTEPAVIGAYARRASALGWHEAAMRHLEQALEANWDEELVDLYARLPVGHVDSRRASAQRWLQQRPASPALLVALARLARQQEQWPQARDFLQRALEQGAGADAWELLGDGLAEAGEHALAAQAYANALLASRGEPVQPLPAALVEAAPDIDPGVRDANGLPRLLESAGAPSRRGRGKRKAARRPPFFIAPARSSALDDRHHAHAAGGADRHQGAAAAALGQLLGGGGDHARAGGGERMAGGQRGADRVDLLRVDPAQRRIQAQAVAAVVLALPRAQGAQHLGGEGFMDLVDVEILQGEVVALEHLGHGHGRGHQQALAMDEVHRRHVRVAQVGQRLVAVGARPLLRGQQHRGGAIGQRGGVGGGQGAAAGGLVERRLERGQLLQR